MTLFVQPGTVSAADSARFQKLVNGAAKAGFVLANETSVRTIPLHTPDRAAEVILAAAVRDGLRFMGIVAQMPNGEYRAEALDSDLARRACIKGLRDFAGPILYKNVVTDGAAA